MELVTYKSTPGLGRYPERERYRVWHSTHKRLMREDSEYRDRVQDFKRSGLRIYGRPTAVCLALILIVWLLVLPAVEGHRLISEASIGIIILIALTNVVLVLYTLNRDSGAAARVHEFQNERIGKVLRESDVAS